MTTAQHADRYSPGTRPPTIEVIIPQLSKRGIFGVWAAAAVPMAAAAWLVAPRLADSLSGPAPLAKALLLSLTAGLVWQFLLVVALVGREQGTLRWAVLREALWLRRPRSPRSGRVGGRVWWVLVPLVILFGLHDLLPVISHPEGRDFGLFLGSEEGKAFLDGAWGWFGIIVAGFVFNTMLGEELLFRGYLLPRMHGAFGDRDWLANGLIFAAYHLHVPWAIPATLVDTFAIAYPSKRYRSALIGIAVHSTQTVFLTLALLTLVV